MVSVSHTRDLLSTTAREGVGAPGNVTPHHHTEKRLVQPRQRGIGGSAARQGSGGARARATVQTPTDVRAASRLPVRTGMEGTRFSLLFLVAPSIGRYARVRDLSAQISHHHLAPFPFSSFLAFPLPLCLSRHFPVLARQSRTRSIVTDTRHWYTPTPPPQGWRSLKTTLTRRMMISPWHLA